MSDTEVLTQALSQTLIAMPAYNEGETIEVVLNDIDQRLPAANIVVINDGTSDSGCRSVAHGARDSDQLA